MKEIEIIQSIINRMGSNSFLIKGWTITIVVGILLLENLASMKVQIFIAYIPLILFWILDSYFLWQERLYRRLYNWDISHRLETNDHLFSLDTDRFKKEISKFAIPFSKSFLLFYGAILISLSIYAICIYLGIIN